MTEIERRLQELADYCEANGFVLIAAVDGDEAITYAIKGTAAQTNRLYRRYDTWRCEQYRKAAK